MGCQEPEKQAPFTKIMFLFCITENDYMESVVLFKLSVCCEQPVCHWGWRDENWEVAKSCRL